MDSKDSNSGDRLSTLTSIESSINSEPNYIALYCTNQCSRKYRKYSKYRQWPFYVDGLQNVVLGRDFRQYTALHCTALHCNILAQQTAEGAEYKKPF
jgi:hypothetical protein